MHTIIIKLGTLHCEFNNGRNGDLLIFELNAALLYKYFHPVQTSQSLTSDSIISYEAKEWCAIILVNNSH